MPRGSVPSGFVGRLPMSPNDGARALHAWGLDRIWRCGVPMTEKTLRWLAILDLLERKGAPLTADQLMQSLASEWTDLQCDLRTVQRDLKAMHALDSLGVEVVDEGAKPLQWQLRSGSAAPSLMGVDAAAALKLILRHVEGLLPDDLLHPMRKQVERADAVLAREARNNPSGISLERRIRMVPLGYALLPPTIEAGLLQRMFEAMRKGCKVQAGYRNQQAVEPRQRTFSVLGMVLRPPKYQIVAYNGERIYTMVLHRMSGATLLEEAALWPQGFDLDAWLRQGESDVGLQQPTQVVLEVNESLAKVWTETPLGPELTVQSLADPPRARLSVRLPITEAFRAYLLSFGAQVRIVEPSWLREWALEHARGILDDSLVDSSGKPSLPQS